VGAWARLKGIQLQYWPELALFITGPPIYQHTAVNHEFWDIQQVRANASVFWRVDIQGQIANQVRQTKRYQQLQMEQVHEEGLALIAKILVAQKLMGTLRDEVQQLGALLPFVAQAPAALDYAAILKTTEVVRSLRDQERKLRREVDELNTLFWFVDET